LQYIDVIINVKQNRKKCVRVLTCLKKEIILIFLRTSKSFEKEFVDKHVIKKKKMSWLISERW